MDSEMKVIVHYFIEEQTLIDMIIEFSQSRIFVGCWIITCGCNWSSYESVLRKCATTCQLAVIWCY